MKIFQYRIGRNSPGHLSGSVVQDLSGPLQLHRVMAGLLKEPIGILLITPGRV